MRKQLPQLLPFHRLHQRNGHELFQPEVSPVYRTRYSSGTGAATFSTGIFRFPNFVDIKSRPSFERITDVARGSKTRPFPAISAARFGVISRIDGRPSPVRVLSARTKRISYTPGGYTFANEIQLENRKLYKTNYRYWFTGVSLATRTQHRSDGVATRNHHGPPLINV